jgi:hypothetical protein
LVTTFYQPKSCQLFKAGDFAYPRAHPGRHWQPATSSSPATLPFPATLPHDLHPTTRSMPHHTVYPCHILWWGIAVWRGVGRVTKSLWGEMTKSLGICPGCQWRPGCTRGYAKSPALKS